MASKKAWAGSTVAVVGGGWAGCAAAVELADKLADKGARVTLFESSRTLGGRARAVEVQGRQLDNGQHILLGAYGETLRLMKRVGIDPRQAFLRLPLQMRYPPASGALDFVTPRLPAPWHMGVALLRAKGLARDDKFALAQLFTGLRWMGWRLNEDVSVSVLLERYGQTARLNRLLWHPLCLAALNTPPERASANVFMATLRDSLGARRAASDMLVPKLALSALFPQAAADYLAARGGVVRSGTRVDALVQTAGGWEVRCPGQPGEAFDSVVLATAPGAASALLAPFAETAALAGQLAGFGHEPIATCYLQYEPGLRLPLPFCALLDDPAAGRFGQFAFDRGQLDPGQAGLLAVVISVASDAAALDQEALAQACAAQLAQAFGDARLAAPLWSRVITEKRATFSCSPGLARPGVLTALPGLVLAGDYTASDYPATLESAVRSGQAAAKAILAGDRLPPENGSLSHAAGDEAAGSVQ